MKVRVKRKKKQKENASLCEDEFSDNGIKLIFIVAKVRVKVSNYHTNQHGLKHVHENTEKVLYV